MTAQIKVKVQRKAQVKLKLLPKFPGNVTGTDGINIDKTGGNYVFSFDPSVVPIPLGSLPPGAVGYALTGNGLGGAASYQGYRRSAVGAGTRTWQDKADDIFSIADFLAPCDAVENDDATNSGNAEGTDSFLNYVAAVAALKLAGGGTLDVPYYGTGKFLWKLRPDGSTPTLILPSNVTLRMDKNVRILVEGYPNGVNGFQPPGFNIATTYASLALVSWQGVFYQSTGAGNVGNVPDTSPANWTALATPYKLAAIVNENLLGAGNTGIHIIGGAFKSAGPGHGTVHIALRNVNGGSIQDVTFLDNVASARIGLSDCTGLLITRNKSKYELGPWTKVAHAVQSGNQWASEDALDIGSGCSGNAITDNDFESGDDCIVLSMEPAYTDGSTTSKDIHDNIISNNTVLTHNGNAIRLYGEATMIAGAIYDNKISHITGIAQHAADSAIACTDYSYRRAIADNTISDVTLNVAGCGQAIYNIVTDEMKFVRVKLNGCTTFGAGGNAATNTLYDTCTIIAGVGNTGTVGLGFDRYVTHPASGYSDGCTVRGGTIIGFDTNVGVYGCNHVTIGGMTLWNPGVLNILLDASAQNTTVYHCTHHSTVAAFSMKETTGVNYSVVYPQDTRDTVLGIDLTTIGANSQYDVPPIADVDGSSIITAPGGTSLPVKFKSPVQIRDGKTLAIFGSASGSGTFTPPAALGSAVWTLPTGTGTFAVTASSPLSLDAATGALTVTTGTLSKTDDTNVTLTLGGTPTNALFNAVSLTLGWTGTLAVSRGGTGISSFGTGVATALGVNVGTAGSFVVNGGALGTPSSATLTSATGLPVSTGITGFGTGVATALGVNVGSAGAFVTFNGAGGTPSSLTLTSATGLPISTGVSGLGTGIATALAVNVGTAGAPVVNGGALGSPSSAGTIPAYTLGGTISGGGNQINNVVIGSTTPLAGTFTTIAGTGATISGANARQLDVTCTSGAGSATVNLTGTGGGVGIFLSTGALAVLKSTTSNIYLSPNNTDVLSLSTTELQPLTDNTVALGDGTHRFTTVFATTGTINTSDATQKTRLSEPDQAVFDAIMDVPLGMFQWLDSIEKKGGGARLHYGTTAQAVRDAFVKRGLDPHRYALFCEDDGVFGLRYDQFTLLRCEAVRREMNGAIASRTK